MAGMPRSVVSRAEAILSNLEKVYGSGEIVPTGNIKQRGKRNAVATSAIETKDNIQLSMFQLDDPVLIAIRDQIKGLDINSLTPLEALNKLNEIKRITGI
jgi:DNA mismatch repair protein MutS